MDGNCPGQGTLLLITRHLPLTYNNLGVWIGSVLDLLRAWQELQWGTLNGSDTSGSKSIFYLLLSAAQVVPTSKALPCLLDGVRTYWAWFIQKGRTNVEVSLETLFLPLKQYINSIASHSPLLLSSYHGMDYNETRRGQLNRRLLAGSFYIISVHEVLHTCLRSKVQALFVLLWVPIHVPFDICW